MSRFCSKTQSSRRPDRSKPGPEPARPDAGHPQVIFGCEDPPVVARFWADALGYQLQGPPEPTAAWQAWQVEHGVPEERWNDASAIIDPDGDGPRIYAVSPGLEPLGMAQQRSWNA
jgi:hypothetical protein